METLIIIAMSVGIIGVPVVVWAYGSYRKGDQKELFEKRRKLVEPYHETDNLFLGDSMDGVQFSLDVVGRDVDEDNLWQKGTVIITQRFIAVYKRQSEFPMLQVSVDSLRGYFNRGKKPQNIWVHLEENGLWYILKIRIDRANAPNPLPMREFFTELMRALRIIANKSINHAYLRQPPYVHLGATEAFIVQEHITGVWELEDEVQLFISPLYLVVMLPDGFISHKIAIETIDDVEALLRFDNDSMGILRFTALGAYHTFALKNYEKWASQLAIAASKAQEIPIEHDILEVKKKLEGE